MGKNQKLSGFGLLGIIIVVAIVVSFSIGGGLYWNETKKQQSLFETGVEAKKRAEELKKQIESREEQIYGGRTSINIDTSDWKTYRNEKYGFEVKYPPNFLLNILHDGTEDKFIMHDERSDGNPSDFYLSISPLSPYKSIREFYNRGGLNNFDENCKPTMLNDLSGFECIPDQGYLPGPYFYLVRNGFVFDSEFGPISETIGRKILSTFKFIN